MIIIQNFSMDNAKLELIESEDINKDEMYKM